MRVISTVKYFSLVVILVFSMILGLIQPVSAVTPKVSLTPSPITITEGDTQQVSIRLDAPIISSDLNPAFVDINLTSSNPSRLSIDTPTVSYASNEWSQVKTFSITAIDDALINGNETVSLNFTVVSNSEYYSHFSGSVSVNLKDNEVSISSPAAGQSIFAGPLTVTGTGPANYYVDLMVDGNDVGTTAINESGEFSLNVGNISSGNHAITAQKKQKRQLAYMTNRSQGTIDVVDILSKSYVHEIAGPDTYYASIFNHRNNKMYAASVWNGMCAVKTFNATTFAIEQSVSMSPDGSSPISLALDKQGNKLYEICYNGIDGYNVVVYDTNTNAPTGSFDLGLDPSEYPSGITINPSNTQIWVRVNGGIRIYNVSDFANVQSLAINPGNNGVNNIVFNEDGSKAYTAESDISDVYVINTSDYSVSTYAVDSYISNLAFTPDFSKLYAISSGTSSIYVLDPNTLAILDQQSTTQPPESLAITDDGLNFVVGDDHNSGQIYFGATAGNATVTNTITAPNGGSYFTSTGNFIGPYSYESVGEVLSLQINVKPIYGVPNTGFGRLSHANNR